jgi:peptide chain release factor subunit 1
VISAALDLQPRSAGSDPTVRPGTIVLRDRLRDLGREMAEQHPHGGEAVDAFEQDREALQGWLEGLDPSVRGALAWTSRGRHLWETVELGVEVPGQVTLGPRPDLTTLARLVDRPRALVALVDSRNVRLFRARYGGLRPLGTGVEDPDDMQQTDVGGWSQSRYQRHVEDHRAHFMQQGSAAIEEELQRARDDVLLLVGDEVATPLLRSALGPWGRDRVHDGPRADIRGSLEELAGEVLPALDAIHRAGVEDRTSTALGEAAEQDRGAAGPQAVREALERAQVMELFVDASLDLGRDELGELISMAAMQDAPVCFVEEHGGLRSAGGMAALLRFAITPES